MTHQPSIFAVSLIVLLLPGLSHAQPAASSNTLTEDVREHIRTRVEAERRGLEPFDVRDGGIHTSASVMPFYENRNFAPVWIDSDGPTAAVDSLLAALRQADREGLNPRDYHVETISSLQRERRTAETPSPHRLSDLELLCTDAFFLYTSHLLSGHVSATKITPSWNVPHRQADLRQLLTDVSKSGTVADDRISADSSSTEFDATLHEAVLRFQERHGLDTDGVVGPATRKALNVSARERVQQLLVNLERWRWLPGTLGPRHVLVNIAAAELQLVENGEETLTMRVVTGRPYRQTPVFSDEISYLVFNPYWHVPHSIATRDQLPEIQKDRSYLDRLQLKVFQGWGTNAQPVDPSAIDWARLSQNHFPYRIRQEPGPHNALGRVKFMFPNRHNVYLHDTPSRGLFAKAERTFSSGCIRLERPIELAEHLLSDHPQWSPQRIQSVLKTPSSEQSVPLRTRVPVHLQYWTAWADPDGTVHFRNDVYQRDGAVLKALNAPTPTEASPGNNARSSF